MKYIVIKVTDKNMARELPVVFPNHMIHSEVSKSLTRMLRLEVPDGRQRQIETVSAGEISCMAFSEDDLCHGESKSLGIKSRGRKDTLLIQGHDYMHGIL